MSAMPSGGLRSPIATVNPSGLGEAVYRACFDLSPAAQVILGPKGELQDLNVQACKVIGMARTELLGRRITDVVHPEDQAVVFAAINYSSEHKTPFEIECRVKTPDQGMRWFLFQSRAADHAELGTVWYTLLADITERKLYQEACMAAETAERASRAKSQFLSRMSHELRTPLNAVIGFAQLLQMDRQPALVEGQKHKVKLIERSGTHLLDVISDVLDLSRIEAGDMPLLIEPILLGNVISDAQAMVLESAQRAAVALTESGQVWGVHVMADRVRLRQVLVNLLSNAVKYNRPDGEVRVNVQLEEGHVLLEVHDNGVGLSDHQISHLFEPFNRLGAEHSGVEGTGIGLVIVHRLVALMGGAIHVASQPGQGTTFTVRLSAVDVDHMSDHGVLDEAVPSSCPATILYAEDNEINVLLVRQILELRPSWRLEVARNGAEALKLAQQVHPDLLLLDMHLGDMSGFELADLLSQDESMRGIPRVALSADAMPDRILEARVKGFSAYLTKPLDVAALLRCLDEHLSMLPLGASA